MDPELAAALKTAVPAELGARIRAARLERGLTQPQLAGQDASVPFLSRIETGTRRPDEKLVEILAARLQVPVEEIVLGVTRDVAAELRLELDYAELSLTTGNPTDALERTERILQSTSGTPRRHAETVRQAQFVRAGSLEALGRVEPAVTLLEELVEDASLLDVLWIRAAIALSRCYRESGDLTRAISTGERAARVLAESRLEDSTEAIQLALTLASAYFAAGDVAYSIRMCERAIARADRIESPVALASAYWNASVFQTSQGATRGAAELAEKALHLYGEQGDARTLARLRSQVGLMHLAADPPDLEAADPHIRRAAEELAVTSASTTDIARNQLTQARLTLLRGDAAEAGRQAAKVAEQITDTSPSLGAAARAMQGRAAILLGDEEGARQHFLAAVHVLTGVGADRAAAQLWFELGELLDSCGETEASRDAYMRAAASTGLASEFSLRSATTRH